MKTHAVFSMLLITALILITPLAPALAGQEVPAQPPVSPLTMVADLAVARPLGVVETVLGGAAFMAALPFSLAAGNTDEVFENLVKTPARYTFKRPVGHNTLGPILTSPIYSTGEP